METLKKLIVFIDASSVIIYIFGFNSLTVLYINIVSASTMLEVISYSFILDKITNESAF